MSKESCNFFCQEDCREGYTKTTGICYQKCGADTNVGCCLCRERCKDGYKDVAGVCWFDRCPAGQEKQGALCYQACKSNEKQIGCCVCREKCRSGYREVGGVCWKGWNSYVPKSRPRTSDGKLLSYTPKTRTKKSYVPAITIGLYPKIVMYFILSLVIMTLVIKLGAFFGVIKSFVGFSLSVFKPAVSSLGVGGVRSQMTSSSDRLL